MHVPAVGPWEPTGTKGYQAALHTDAAVRRGFPESMCRCCVSREARAQRTWRVSSCGSARQDWQGDWRQKFGKSVSLKFNEKAERALLDEGQFELDDTRHAVSNAVHVFDCVNGAYYKKFSCTRIPRVPAVGMSIWTAWSSCCCRPIRHHCITRQCSRVPLAFSPSSCKVGLPALQQFLVVSYRRDYLRKMWV